jgi:uncharacterized Zn finger protein
MSSSSTNGHNLAYAKLYVTATKRDLKPVIYNLHAKYIIHILEIIKNVLAGYIELKELTKRELRKYKHIYLKLIKKGLNSAKDIKYKRLLLVKYKTEVSTLLRYYISDISETNA